MRTTLAALFGTMLALGCSAAHEPRVVGSGIYDLTVRGDVDRCTPTRTTGALGLVGIVSQGGLVNVAVPDGDEGALARVSLSEHDGFHTETAIDIPGCESTSLRRSWTILDTSRDGFQLALTEEWIGIERCAAASEIMPAAPDADCRADRVLEYRLMEPCSAPCEVHVIAGAATCACD
ncbi:MAG: hypothetical protein M3Y87_15075 [Myxococcota bacterium]|nr:hypothetical protein [Myxococcota bacterium]